MKPRVKLELTIPCFKKLAEFLEGHEYEIATEECAYGELRELFVEIFEAEPSEDC